VSVRIAPSILAADFARLGEAVAAVEAGGADLIHVDVMDGHFVPNISMGTPIIASLARATRLPLDVHLMIDEPDRYLEVFVKAGAAGLTVHAEVVPHLGATLDAIRRLGANASVAINPDTPLDVLDGVGADLDHVLVMTVHPGFTGQSFLPHSIERVRQVAARLAQAGSRASIAVDGGIDASNARAVSLAGASILVAGAAVFHTADPGAAVKALRAAAALT
jgi:ribulose-phosphate 3-epimerase